LFSESQTFSQPEIRGKKAVNNPGAGSAPGLGFIGCGGLFTRSSPVQSGEQTVHINSLSVGRFAL
jgi:hypothetical protein